MNDARSQIHFVTGKLAEQALRRRVASLSAELGFDYTIQVLPITVAALLTPAWIAPRLEIPEGTTEVLLPGYAQGDLAPIRERTDKPVRFGPKDLRDLSSFLGGRSQPPDLTAFDIEIIAEINHAPRLPLDEILSLALGLARSGADLIDVGCLPGTTWGQVADCVSLLRDHGLRVSIDSLNPLEIGPAVRAGAELVLSVNQSNREAAVDWGCEVVAIPDDPGEWERVETTLEYLEAHRVRWRLDPILEPIGLGFAESLQRYGTARQRWPQAAMMMGIGNLTELSDVDSAGVNFLLLGICQELGIHSILTTQVINWARTSVQECDLARRIVKYAVDHKVPPKRVSQALVCLRDHRVTEFGDEFLEDLQRQVRDRNYRILAEQERIHVFGLEDHFSGVDPFELFDQLHAAHPRNVDPSHAFYLGYELCKAELANLLGKQYTQDEPLSWGFLTPSTRQHLRLRRRSPPPTDLAGQ